MGIIVRTTLERVGRRGRTSRPSTTTTLMVGNPPFSPASGPYRSTTARSEFLSSSKQMCDLRVNIVISHTFSGAPVRSDSQMPRYVSKAQLLRTYELNRRPRDHAVVLLYVAHDQLPSPIAFDVRTSQTNRAFSFASFTVWYTFYKRQVREFSTSEHLR